VRVSLLLIKLKGVLIIFAPKQKDPEEFNRVVLYAVLRGRQYKVNFSVCPYAALGDTAPLILVMISIDPVLIFLNATNAVTILLFLGPWPHGELHIERFAQGLDL
jgi:hypothetical protein